MIGTGRSYLRDWHFVLASASPSRLRLLRDCGLQPEVHVSSVDERALEVQLATQTPSEIAVHLAQAKARDVAGESEGWNDKGPSGCLILGADSVLDVDGKAQGKPGTADRAFSRAQALRGRSARLITGHCLIAIEPDGTKHETAIAARSTVHFGRTTDEELSAYVATGEPLNVAGGFTLDGLSAPFIEGISGDPSNVIGLSLPTLRQSLADWGIVWIP